jgi:hypothetical protein
VNQQLYQDTFNTAVLALVKQGKPSMRGDLCAYSDRQGNHCAIGWLLKEHPPEIENVVPFKPSRWSSKAVKSSERLAGLLRDIGFNQEDSEFLQRLQSCHDMAVAGPGFVADFLERAKDLAVLFKLTFPELPAAPEVAS